MSEACNPVFDIHWRLSYNRSVPRILHYAGGCSRRIEMYGGVIPIGQEKPGCSLSLFGIFLG